MFKTIFHWKDHFILVSCDTNPERNLRMTRDTMPAAISKDRPSISHRWNVYLMLFVVGSLMCVASVERALAEEPELVQLMCPVMPEQPVDRNIIVEYEGRKVYLCCQKCRRLFETNPEEYASAIVLTSAPIDQPDVAVTGGGFEASKLGGLHPVVVHFPIAMLISAAVARCLMLMGSTTWAGPAVRFCVLIGSVSAVVATGLGWLEVGAPGPGEAAGDVLFNHRWLGVGSAVLGVVALVLVELEARKPSKAISRVTTVALLAVALLVGLAGHFGGVMVHGPDHLPW